MQLKDRIVCDDQGDEISELHRQIVDSQTRFQMTLSKLKAENKRVKQLAR
jgi:hypothetical protein